ncbi:MAG: hypothetical protein ACOY3L_16355 [Pseudomonadota bacterium]
MTPWALPEDRAARLALATGYPYAIPAASYLFEDGAARPLPVDADYSGRTPVLAIGSNRSPAQLARKFAHMPRPQRIPVTRAWLADFDVVFATHLARYGAIPGNLYPALGVMVRVAVTWLDPEQLAAMHATELAGEAYVYARLDGIDLRLDRPGAGGALRLESVAAYVSLHGAFAEAGQPLGLAALEAQGRRHAAVSVAGALDRLRRRAGDARDLDAFILAAIEDKALRQRLTALMRADALPLPADRVTVLER